MKVKNTKKILNNDSSAYLIAFLVGLCKNKHFKKGLFRLIVRPKSEQEITHSEYEIAILKLEIQELI